ncbi:MAG: hypothetical protein KJ043_23605, partial [Anaerolineae bacterium]|nr:hypothetical protein [Anaerolineae bacterium]
SPVINGSDISIPIQCLTNGTTTIDITVDDIDFINYPGTGNLTVNPGPPTGILTATDQSCLAGSSTSVPVDYTNSTFPGRTISSIVVLSSSDTGIADIVGNNFSAGVNNFDVAINCGVGGSATITVQITDSNGDSYSDTATVLVDPSPPYFSGGTSFTCNQGDTLNMSFEYLEFEGGNTLTAVNANSTGFLTITSATLINGNMWVEVLVTCDLAGTSGTVDINADTTSVIHPTVSVTGITVDINP